MDVGIQGFWSSLLVVALPSPVYPTAENESRHMWRVGPFLRPSPAQGSPSDMGSRGPSVDLPSGESRRLLAAAGMALGWLFWIVSLEAPLFCQAACVLLQTVSGLGLPCAACVEWTGLVRGGCAVDAGGSLVVVLPICPDCASWLHQVARGRGAICNVLIFSLSCAVPAGLWRFGALARSSDCRNKGRYCLGRTLRDIFDSSGGCLISG